MNYTYQIVCCKSHRRGYCFSRRDISPCASAVDGHPCNWKTSNSWEVFHEERPGQWEHVHQCHACPRNLKLLGKEIMKGSSFYQEELGEWLSHTLILPPKPFIVKYYLQTLKEREKTWESFQSFFSKREIFISTQKKRYNIFTTSLPSSRSFFSLCLTLKITIKKSNNFLFFFSKKESLKQLHWLCFPPEKTFISKICYISH